VLGIPYLYTVDEQGNKHIWRFFGEYDSLATADTVPEAILNKASLGSLAYGQGRIFWEYYLPAGETRSLIFLGWNKEMDDIYKQALAAVGGDRKKVNIGAYIWVWPWRGNPNGDLYHYNDYIAFYDLTSLMFYYDYQPEPPNNWPNTGTCDENFLYWKKEGDKYILAGHIAEIEDRTMAGYGNIYVLHLEGKFYVLRMGADNSIQEFLQVSPDENGYFTTSFYTYRLTGQYGTICGFSHAVEMNASVQIGYLSYGHLNIYSQNYPSVRYEGDLYAVDIPENTTYQLLGTDIKLSFDTYFMSYQGIKFERAALTYWDGSCDLKKQIVWKRPYGTKNGFLIYPISPFGDRPNIGDTLGTVLPEPNIVLPIHVETSDPGWWLAKLENTSYYAKSYHYCAREVAGTYTYKGWLLVPTTFQFGTEGIPLEFFGPIYNSSLPSLTASTDLISAIFSCKQPTGSYSGWFGWAQWIGDWFVYLVCLLWSLIKGLVFVIAAFLGFLVVIVGGVLMLIFYLLQMFAGIVTQVGQAFQEMNYPWNIVIAEVLLMGTYGLVMHTYDMIPMLNRR